MTDDQTPPDGPPITEAMRLPPQLYDFILLCAEVAPNLPIGGPQEYIQLARQTTAFGRSAFQRRDAKDMMNSALMLGACALSLYMIAMPDYIEGMVPPDKLKGGEQNGATKESDVELN